MVLGQLGQFALVEQINATVAHVGHRQLLLAGHTDKGQHAQRGAHPEQLGVAAGLFEHRFVGPDHRVDHPLDAVQGAATNANRGQLVHQRFQGQSRGHLAAAVTAHAIGHRVHSAGPFSQSRVLVVGAHPAHIAVGAASQTNHATNSNMVEPTWTWSPTSSNNGPDTLLRFR